MTNIASEAELPLCAREEQFAFAAPGAIFRLMVAPHDAQAAQEVAMQLIAWWAAPSGSLEAAFGLPTTTEEWRLLRDAELCKAAEYVDFGKAEGRGRWGPLEARRAEALAIAVQEFLVRRWPSWRRLLRPPTFSRPLDRHLFWAAKCRCGDLPQTRQGLRKILSGCGNGDT